MNNQELLEQIESVKLSIVYAESAKDRGDETDFEYNLNKAKERLEVLAMIFDTTSEPVRIICKNTFCDQY